jgi:hypothetical protein
LACEMYTGTRAAPPSDQLLQTRYKNLNAADVQIAYVRGSLFTVKTD